MPAQKPAWPNNAGTPAHPGQSTAMPYQGAMPSIAVANQAPIIPTNNISALRDKNAALAATYMRLMAPAVNDDPVQAAIAAQVRKLRGMSGIQSTFSSARGDASSAAGRAPTLLGGGASLLGAPTMLGAPGSGGGG